VTATAGAQPRQKHLYAKRAQPFLYLFLTIGLALYGVPSDPRYDFNFWFLHKVKQNVLTLSNNVRVCKSKEFFVSTVKLPETVKLLPPAAESMRCGDLRENEISALLAVAYPLHVNFLTLAPNKVSI
jgi:hypothetical protein